MSLKYALYLHDQIHDSEEEFDTPLEVELSRKELLIILTGLELTGTMFPCIVEDMNSLYGKFSSGMEGDGIEH